ncbi:hypothetical protein G3480_24365 [Thiorhodococcus mannitoliphagus]|uniref:DUF3761 domain-containing protein n=1 Tax=Thiorhodococcus mannitoliphagus TaxID=329406 RepID=A0A6P1E0G4_9GAMM|nr:hypothetical protein [Thiorhodococcus mannitoliphagus]
MTCVAALAFALVGLTPVAIADPPSPQPIIKTGPCPSGYSTRGGYCAPGSTARFALAKQGPCPSGYSTSGDYCLAGRQARAALPKVGNCPSGWSTSGAYCLQQR